MTSSNPANAETPAQEPTVRVAGIDCGTNSIRLLIADVTAGKLVDVTRQMRVVRLGQGVDRTGRLDPIALERTFAAAQEYAALCREHGVKQIRFVATSATRDASNRDEFIAGIREILGVEPEVITGETEAALSFAGAARVLHDDAVAHLPQETSPALVVDIGGGSTEMVVGDPATGEVLAATSLDMGCVRMTERHFRHDPPLPEEVAAAVADIEVLLDQAAAALPLEQVHTLVGVAGSVTTLTAHTLGLSSYQPEEINCAAVPVSHIAHSAQLLRTQDQQERAAYGFMHPGRVDVIAAGALVWERIVARVSQAAGLEFAHTSEHDILDGIALSVAASAQ